MCLDYSVVTMYLFIFVVHLYSMCSPLEKAKDFLITDCDPPWLTRHFISDEIGSVN